jgi:hypothetical protein
MTKKVDIQPVPRATHHFMLRRSRDAPEGEQIHSKKWQFALLGPTALIFLGRHAGRTVKRSREAGLRGEMRIERDLGERQLARRQFRHRILQPHAAYVAVWRDAYCECEHPGEMKSTIACYSGQIYKQDVVRDVCFDIV